MTDENANIPKQRVEVTFRGIPGSMSRDTEGATEILKGTMHCSLKDLLKRLNDSEVLKVGTVSGSPKTLDDQLHDCVHELAPLIAGGLITSHDALTLIEKRLPDSPNGLLLKVGTLLGYWIGRLEHSGNGH